VVTVPDARDGLADVESSVLERSQSNCGVSAVELPDRIVRENETPY
jgi:hypothetical protein